MTTSSRYARKQARGMLPRASFWALCVAWVVANPLAAKADTNAWTGSTSGGGWDNGSNWSQGRNPNSTDEVVINTLTSGSVLLDINSTIDTLSIVAGNALVFDTFGPGATLNAINGMVNSGTLTVQNSFENNNSMTLASTLGSFENEGTLRFSDRFSFVNADLVNTGTIEVGPGDVGETQVTELIKVDGTYFNSGTINVLNGNLVVRNGGTFNQSSGVINANTNRFDLYDTSTLNIAGGVFNLVHPVGPAGSRMRLFGNGTVNLTGGDLNMGAVIDLGNVGNGTFIQDGGTLHATNGVSYFWEGTYVYRSGTIDGAAILRESTLQLDSTDPATFQFSKYTPADGPGTLDIVGGRLQPGQTIDIHSIGQGTEVEAAGFFNDGLIRLSNTNGGTPRLTITTSVLENSPLGVIESDGGEIFGQILNYGGLNFEAGTTVTNNSIINNAALNVSAGASLQGMTQFVQAGGQALIGGNLSTAANAELRANGGTLAITGDATNHTGFIGMLPGDNGFVTVSGPTASWVNSQFLSVGEEGTGSLTIELGADVNSGIDGHIGRLVGSTGSAIVTGAGSTWQSSSLLIVGDRGTGTLEVESGGTVTSTSGSVGRFPGSAGDITVSGSGSTWTMAGPLAIGGDVATDLRGGTGVVTVESGGAVSAGNTQVFPDGLLNLDGGTFSTATLVNSGVVELGGMFTVTNGVTLLNTGVLKGTGTVGGDVSSAGRVAPGNSPGIITIDGDYTQQAGGVLEIEVGGYMPGTQHDQLLVTGAATLAGRLEVPILQPFNPSGGPIAGQTIDFLSAATRSGEFSAVVSPNLDALYPGLAIDVTYLADGAQLKFVPTQTNIVFDESSGSNPSFFSLNTWENTADPMLDLIPSLANDVTITTTVAGNPEVIVAAGNALVAKLTLGGSNSEPLTMRIGNGNALDNVGNLSSTTGVAILENATVAMDQDTLATSQVIIDGGTLVGNGLVDLSSQTSVGKLTVTSGTISPGFSVGHLDIDGDLNLTAGGELVIEATSETMRDTIAVTGEAILEGTLTLDLTGSSLQGGESIQILTAQSITEDLSSFNVVGNDELLFFLRTEEIDDDMFALFSEGFYEGDMNRGGGLPDLDDVAAFALALTNPRGPGGYSNTYGGTSHELGDLDDDGDCDVDDIDDFAELLGMSLEQLVERIQAQSNTVPEPSAAMLMLCSSLVLMLAGRGRRLHLRGE